MIYEIFNMLYSMSNDNLIKSLHQEINSTLLVHILSAILNNIKEECPLKSVTRQLAEELHPSERHLLPILQPIIDVLFLSPILLLLASLFCLCKRIEEGVCHVNLQYIRICFLLKSFKAT